jgi:hypothetical protein
LCALPCCGFRSGKENMPQENLHTLKFYLKTFIIYHDVCTNFAESLSVAVVFGAKQHLIEKILVFSCFV